MTEDLTLISDPVLFGRHIAELNATNNALVRSYVWGLDLSGTLDGAGGVGGLLWLTVHAGPAAGTHFCGYDGNGNVVDLVTATTGTETARYEYGPFGEPIRVTGSASRPNPFRFSTKRTDDTTDLVLYEYRAYSSSLGRWLSRDPIGERGGRNLYGFVHNDGMNKVDPDGRAVLVDDAVLAAVVGGIVVCTAATAWLNSPAGRQAMHDIAVAATSVADAIAEGVKAAAKRCERCVRRTKNCKPCNPPVGSIAYRAEKTGPAHHGIPTPHSHMFVMLQSPPEKGCVCFWVEVLKDPVPGIQSPEIPPPPYGGGVAP